MKCFIFFYNFLRRMHSNIHMRIAHIQVPIIYHSLSENFPYRVCIIYFIFYKKHLYILHRNKNKLCIIQFEFKVVFQYCMQRDVKGFGKWYFGIIILQSSMKLHPESISLSKDNSFNFQPLHNIHLQLSKHRKTL